MHQQSVGKAVGLRGCGTVCGDDSGVLGLELCDLISETLSLLCCSSSLCSGRSDRCIMILPLLTLLAQTLQLLLVSVLLFFLLCLFLFPLALLGKRGVQGLCPVCRSHHG